MTAESELQLAPMLSDSKRGSYLRFYGVTFLVLAVIFVSDRQSGQMEELERFANHFFAAVQPSKLPNKVRVTQWHYGYFGLQGFGQTRTLSLVFTDGWKNGGPEANRENSIRVRFKFIFKGGQWIMLDQPAFDPQRDANASASALQRKLLAESEDLQTVIAYIEAHKDEAFEAAVKKFPMTPSGWMN